MVKNKRFTALLLSLLALVLGYVLFGWNSDNFEFSSLSSPARFRELVLDNQSTERGSVLLSIPGSQAAAFTDTRKNLIPDLCKALYGDTMSPSQGAKGADVILVEFFDYRCPYCKTLSSIIHEVQKRHRLRVIYKEWPILGANSRLASRAALAAHKQGKYLEYHTRLMQSRFIPTPAYIEDMAAHFDLDRASLRDDMNAEETLLTLRRTAALAKSLNLVGTPALIVGRTIVQGAISRRILENLIEKEAATKQLHPCFAAQ